MDSSACGHYCLALAIYTKLNQSKYPNLLQCCNEFINMFGDDAIKNDAILKHYLQSILKQNRITSNIKVELLLNRI